MRDIFVACIVFGMLPFVLKRPFWGILLLTWLGYMNPHRLCFGFMLTMPVVQIVAIMTMIGMAISKEAKHLVWSREMSWLVAFVIFMGITTLDAYYPVPAQAQYVKVIKIQILTLMTLLMLTSPDRIRMFVWIIVLSLGFYGVKGGLYTIAHGGTGRVQGPDATFIGGNNELALALVMTIPLMRWLQMHESRRWLRMVLTGMMLLSAISAIGSQSRGALVALTLTGMIFWLKGRNKAAVGVLILLAAVAIGLLMPDSWYDRMNTIDDYQQDASAMGRLNAWGMAWNLASHRLLGGGFETWQIPQFAMFAAHPEDVHDAHSIYFKVLGEHGFIGLAIFLTLLLMTWTKCSKTIRISRFRPELAWARDLATMIQVSLVGYMSAGAFLGLAYFDYFYHLLALTVVVFHLARQAPRPVPASVVPGQPHGRPLAVGNTGP